MYEPQKTLKPTLLKYDVWIQARLLIFVRGSLGWMFMHLHQNMWGGMDNTKKRGLKPIVDGAKNYRVAVENFDNSYGCEVEDGEAYSYKSAYFRKSFVEILWLGFNRFLCFRFQVDILGADRLRNGHLFLSRV